MTALPQTHQPSNIGCDPKYYGQWLNEVAFFVRNRATFLADPALNGKWIALREHQIIDRDENEFELARRIDRQFPSEVVLISKVEPESQVKVHELPSLELR